MVIVLFQDIQCDADKIIANIKRKKEKINEATMVNLVFQGIQHNGDKIIGYIKRKKEK